MNDSMDNWFQIDNIDQIDSPALVVYPQRMTANIELAKKMTGDVTKLRPHVKTNKMKEVCLLMMQAGIVKFKCATIAEAEMLALVGAPDVFLAYQPVGPKICRLIKLVKAFPKSRFSCLLDHPEIASVMNSFCQKQDVVLDVYIDLNTGMNRTGVQPSRAPDLAKTLLSLHNLHLVGIHGYDGHVRASNIVQRQQEADASYAALDSVYQKIQPLFPYPLLKVIGGTPAFSIHAHRSDCECSPGTFVFWDWRSNANYSEMLFEYAALVVCRIVSIIDNQHLCVDLGHKSIAAESPLPCACFLNAPHTEAVLQSEEHLVLKVPDSSAFSIGQVLYGVPKHICPTVALYEKAWVVENGMVTHSWKVIARDRYINF